MIFEFIYPLVIHFTPFNIFQYLTIRGAYAALTTLLLCYMLGPRIIVALKKLNVGQVVREDGPASHLAKDGTPTMGGIFIVLSIVVSMVAWTDIRSGMVWLALAALVCFGILGFVDDYLKIKRDNSDGLRPKIKLLFQFIIALAIMLILYNTGGDTNLYIPFIRNPVLDMGVLWIPFGVLFIMASSNAVNFSDGLDGLLAGLLIIVFIALAILTYLSGRADFSYFLGIPFIPGSGELMIFCLAAMGACIGFLWFNSHPAEVFMGDTGSLALGGVIAVISLMVKKEILIIIIGGVFVLEIASVIIQVVSYKLRGKRVFKMAPLHHHFELSGWVESKIVIRFWILGGLFAIIALSTLKVQ